MLTPLTIALLLMAGILLHHAIIHLIHMGRKQLDNILRWYGFLCLIAASYAFACIHKYQATDLATYTNYARWSAVSARWLMVLLPWFIAYYTGYRPRKLLLVISSLFGVVGALDLLLPTRYLYPGDSPLIYLQTPWGEKIATWSGGYSPLIYVLYFAYLLVILQVGFSLRHLLRHGEPRRFVPFALLTLFAVAGFINDALLDEKAIQSFYLEEFVLMGFLLLLGTWLGSRRLRAEANYRTLFNAINDAIYVHDARTGLILDLNEAAARMHGTTREILLRDYRTTMFSEGPYSLENALKRITQAERESPQVFEWRIRRLSDGEILWVEVALRAEVLNGQPVVLASVRDITARKSAEEKLRETQKLESLGVLAGGVAHDFNNLLTTILGNTDLACHDLPPGSPAQGNLENIRSATRKAADLCRQLLAYSGKGRFAVGPVDLSALVNDLVRLLKVSMPPGVHLVPAFSGPVPVVIADATQVRQVVMNLVLNAAESMTQRTGDIRVATGSVRLDRNSLASLRAAPDAVEGTYAFVEVSDEGCGMDEATQSRVFEPFFSTKFTGRGLGMAAVLGILRGHKGAISLESSPNRGTVVRAYFPADPTAESVVPASRSTTAPSSSNRPWILAVDDDEAVRTSLARALETVGYSALTAESGPKALEILRERGTEVAAALVDLNMPGWDGEKTLRELKAARSDLKVILVSGEGSDRSVPGTGFDGYLPKPYQFEELRDVLRKTIGRS